MTHLAKSEQARIRLKMESAYAKPTYASAKAALEALRPPSVRIVDALTDWIPEAEFGGNEEGCSMQYSQERREAVLKKLLPPQSLSVKAVAKAEGIAPATLYQWRQEARAQGRLAPEGASAQEWSSRDKFAAVVETASLSEAEVAEYCRKRGLYPEQLAAWRQACEQANDWERSQQHKLKAVTQQDRGRIKELERELRHKDRALAETAALLVLRKKAQAIWGEPEGA